jgi:glycerol kinase
MGKATYGTGSSVMMNIGNEPLDPPAGLVTSIGYARKGQIGYVFEGNIHATGDTLLWLTNELNLIGSPEEAESLANSLPDNGGVYLVPAFSGLGAPYWDNGARACISGLSRNTTRAHLARAALEGIAYQIRDLIRAMEQPGGTKLHELRVDGGPTRNRFLMQFQADLLKKRVVAASIAEISALGSAYMAGLAAGFWSGVEEIASMERGTGGYNPSMEEEKTERLYEGWTRAVARARLY